jgi:hypothetical protein
VLAAGEPGKEILYPVATVILGGVISSTLLDFFVHPALFWLFGLQAAQRVVSESREEIALVEAHEESPVTAAPSSVHQQPQGNSATISSEGSTLGTPDASATPILNRTASKGTEQTKP